MGPHLANAHTTNCWKVPKLATRCDVNHRSLRHQLELLAKYFFSAENTNIRGDLELDAACRLILVTRFLQAQPERTVLCCTHTVMQGSATEHVIYEPLGHLVAGYV